MFEFSEYKTVLKDKIEKNRSMRGYQKRLANACNCHTSFISQVINSHLQLTPDHAADLCHFWGLSELETEYFMALVELERSSSVVLKKRIHSKMETLRAKHKKLSERIGTSSAVEEEGRKSFYYSSWQVMAIHVCCSIPEFNTAEAISNRLKLSLSYVNRVLNQLEANDYLRLDEGRYYVTDKDLHLHSQSNLVKNHHRNWRSFVMSKLGEEGDNEIHYSTLFAMSERDYETLREMVIMFIDKARTVVKSSKEENLYNLNLDLGRV